MSTQKTNKALAKRVKKTKNGKIVARKAGKNHFNAKASSEKMRERGRTQKLDIKKKKINRMLPHS